MPRQYSDEFKKQVVSFCVAGNPLSAASEKYQLAQSTLYRWCREYNPTGNQFSVKDCTAIRRQCERLEHILQIIRCSNIIEGVPRRKRLEILAKLHEQFEQYSVQPIFVEHAIRFIKRFRILSERYRNRRKELCTNN